jgi:hypothetical protein
VQCDTGGLRWPIITAGGVTSGIDFGLIVMAELIEEERPRTFNSLSNMRRRHPSNQDVPKAPRPLFFKLHEIEWQTCEANARRLSPPILRTLSILKGRAILYRTETHGVALVVTYATTRINLWLTFASTAGMRLQAQSQSSRCGQRRQRLYMVLPLDARSGSRPDQPLISRSKTASASPTSTSSRAKIAQTRVAMARTKARSWLTKRQAAPCCSNSPSSMSCPSMSR